MQSAPTNWWVKSLDSKLYVEKWGVYVPADSRIPPVFGLVKSYLKKVF